MECCKMLAATLIVFAHVSFPGVVGELVNCFVRFSVPVFFAISGYFSFGAKADKIFNRLIHIIKLSIFAVAVHIIWGCTEAIIRGENLISAIRGILPGPNGIAAWLFMHVNPFSGHLWYLAAIAAAYAMLWLYAAFYGDDDIRYQPLYTASFVLFAIRFTMCDLMRFVGYDMPFFFCRDGLFYGLPMISLGLFLREHYDSIHKNYRLTDRKVLILFLIGVLLSLLQWKTFGTGELPMGAGIQAVAMLLFTIEHPTADFGMRPLAKAISVLGYLSTAVYIMHMIVNDAYMLFIEQKLTALLGEAEHWLQPFIVLFATIVVSLVFKAATDALKKKKTKQ